MPLPPPPAEAGSLSTLPKQPVAGKRLYRVWRHELPGGRRRTEPWWFASAAFDAPEGGRFDLPKSMGTCYFGTKPEAALLEALQSLLTNLPSAELAVRRMATVAAPAEAPPAAMLTARKAAGEFGITAELWAGRDRSLTRRWAQAIRRDGWWAAWSGISHDPSGRLRSVALFDAEGEHAPTHGGRWHWKGSRIDDDRSLRAAMERYGVHVREPGQLPWARPPAD